LMKRALLIYYYLFFIWVVSQKNHHKQNLHAHFLYYNLVITFGYYKIIRYNSLIKFEKNSNKPKIYFLITALN